MYSRLYQGLGPGIPLWDAIGSHGGRLREGTFPLFGDSAPRDEEAVLFFPPPVEDSSSSSSSSSSEEGWALESSDFASEASRRRRPLRVFLTFLEASFFGAS